MAKLRKVADLGQERSPCLWMLPLGDVPVNYPTIINTRSYETNGLLTIVVFDLITDAGFNVLEVHC